MRKKKLQQRKKELCEAARDRAERRKLNARFAELSATRAQEALQAKRDPVARLLSKSKELRKIAETNNRFAKLCGAIQTKAPRLMADAYIKAFVELSKLNWCRPLYDWTPRGKGRETLFRSLCSHLLAKYPSPDFLWSALAHEDAARLGPLVARLGTGLSLFKLSKTGTMPIPLTKRQCHRVLTSSSSEDFLSAIRRAQLDEFGASKRTLDAWLRTERGGRLGTASDEEFWLSFIRLCCQTPMFDPDQLSPLSDYVVHCREQRRDFSMKGRTIRALMRGMEEWHTELHLAHRRRLFTYPDSFPTSGFAERVYDYSQNDKKTGRQLKRTWRVREILTSRELLGEGKQQQHCVYSYGRSIVNGSASIWSLTLDEGAGHERRLTIEVRNKPKQVVQVRGYRNRVAKSTEHRIIVRWAQENGLVLGRGV